jgi:putative ABC transport system permease protein
MHDHRTTGETPVPNAHRARMGRRYLRFWGPRAAADVDEELQFHIEMRIRDAMARGLSEAEARVATARRLGDLALARSECVASTSRRERRMTRALLIDALLQDLRFGVRTLGRQKAWTAVGVLTLALGIGANTAMFSVVNNLMLHPLQYPNASRLAVVFQQPSNANNTGMRVIVTVDPHTARSWQEGTRLFEDLQPYNSTELTLQPRTGASAMIQTAAVLPGFAKFAGQGPLVGRNFTDADIAAQLKVVILGEAFWRQRFGSDPRIVGQSMTLNGSPYEIIGVMPAAFQLPALIQEATDVWLPLNLNDAGLGLSIVGRLRRGATYVQAARELDSLSARANSAAKPAFTASVVPPSQLVRFHDSLLLLTSAVALVLIIACANVAHLLLARGAARQRELAIRAALGAGGGRLLRQLITESLVLAAAGCVAGVFVGWIGLRLLISLRPDSMSQLSSAHMDATTLVVSVAVSLVTGLVFGLVGASQSSRLSSHEVLKAGALTASHGRPHTRLRSALVITEMALSMTLLVGATLLVRSVVHLQLSNPGFEPAGLYAITPKFPAWAHSTAESRAAFVSEITERARSVAGVEAITRASAMVPTRNFQIGALEIEGETPPPRGSTSFIDVNDVSPNFFRVMGIRMLEGSTFTDTSAHSDQIVINEGMAKKHWPQGSAIGHLLRVSYDGKGVWKTIVGVVNDATIGGRMVERSQPMMYLAASGEFTPELVLRVKPGTKPMAAFRALVANADPRLPPPEITNIESAMANSIAGQRFTMLVLTVFTMFAVLLAAIGLYGVMAYAVAQRTREIGIRIALGATRRNIARAVLKQGLMLGVAGIVVGSVASHWATKLLQDMLAGVTVADPLSFAIAALVLLSTIMIACVVPMRRAVAVEPMVAIREA